MNETKTVSTSPYLHDKFLDQQKKMVKERKKLERKGSWKHEPWKNYINGGDRRDLDHDLFESLLQVINENSEHWKIVRQQFPSYDPMNETVTPYSIDVVHKETLDTTKKLELFLGVRDQLRKGTKIYRVTFHPLEQS